ncbi:MAG: hypothetical protein ABWK53_05880 [Anaerolineales bacterium]
MRVYFVPIFILLSLLAACAPAEIAGPSLATQGAEPATATPLRFTGGGLVFVLESPAEGAVVRQPQVLLRGTVNAEAVLSIDEQIYLLPAGQPFEVPVPLLEGPNALGIVVSDYEGNVIEFVLTVIYEP